MRAQDQADNLTALQEKFQDQWADLFIVSDVEVSDDPALYAQGSDTPIAGVRGTGERGQWRQVRALLEAPPAGGRQRGPSPPCAPGVPRWSRPSICDRVLLSF